MKKEEEKMTRRRFEGKMQMKLKLELELKLVSVLELESDDKQELEVELVLEQVQGLRTDLWKYTSWLKPVQMTVWSMETKKMELVLGPEPELGLGLGLGLEMWKRTSYLKAVQVTELLMVMQMVDWLSSHNSLAQGMELALALDMLRLMVFRSLGRLLEKEHLQGMMCCLYCREQEPQDKMNSYRHYLLVVMPALMWKQRDSYCY